MVFGFLPVVSSHANDAAKFASERFGALFIHPSVAAKARGSIGVPTNFRWVCLK
jgi:hypothetical protein